ASSPPVPKLAQDRSCHEERGPARVYVIIRDRTPRPWSNGMDVTRRPSGQWVIDFGAHITENDAALFEVPFNYVRKAIDNENGERKKWASLLFVAGKHEH
ncbi:hypothetical protein, partial [Paracoccus hibiscisoli]|uniref:hypothetical protein n=2 Tax=Paracoccus TaxID=265 RepID=UPI0023F2437C